MSAAPKVRTATEADAADLAAIYAPFVTETAVSFESEPPEANEMRERIARTLLRFPYLVAETAGDVMGYAYAGQLKDRAAYARAAETTIYLAPEARGRGMGRLLYTALLDQLRDRGFHTAIGIIALPNAASVALHEAVGFRHAGTIREAGRKFDRWHDVGYYQTML